MILADVTNINTHPQLCFGYSLEILTNYALNTHCEKIKVFSTYMYIYSHYLDSCFAVKYQLTA